MNENSSVAEVLSKDENHITNLYMSKFRNPSERKYCGSGFHGSDNLFSNMQVSKPSILC